MGGNEVGTRGTDGVQGSHTDTLVDLIGHLSNPSSTLSSLFGELEMVKKWPVRSPASNYKTGGLKQQAQNRLTSEQIAGLVTAYQVGSTVLELAESFSIHRTTVLRHLKYQQVPRRRFRLNQIDIEKAVHLYTLGKSCETIAFELRVGASTIRRDLKKAGVELRRQGRS